MKQIPLAVVGGGPAGLSAAIAAARAGVQVTLFNEQTTLGGQLRYRILDGETVVAPLANSLVADAIDAGVDLQPNTKVWGLFTDRVLGIAHADRSTYLQATQVILATGSTDLPFPFVGGSLPGVMTARGLQMLLHCARILPGERFAVVGTGPDASEVARDIDLAGGQVVITVDPLRSDPTLAAEGDQGVQTLTVDGNRYDVDVVVIAVGRQPDAELAMMAECDCGYSPIVGGIVPIRNENLQTSVDGIIVAGDGAGVSDLATVLAEGTFAGICAARALGTVSEETLATARQTYRQTVGALAERDSGVMPVPIHV